VFVRLLFPFPRSPRLHLHSILSPVSLTNPYHLTGPRQHLLSNYTNVLVCVESSHELARYHPGTHHPFALSRFASTSTSLQLLLSSNPHTASQCSYTIFRLSWSQNQRACGHSHGQTTLKSLHSDRRRSARPYRSTLSFGAQHTGEKSRLWSTASTKTQVAS
jgi:hypothetical protein